MWYGIFTTSFCGLDVRIIMGKENEEVWGMPVLTIRGADVKFLIFTTGSWCSWIKTFPTGAFNGGYNILLCKLYNNAANRCSQ